LSTELIIYVSENHQYFLFLSYSSFLSWHMTRCKSHQDTVLLQQSQCN